MNDICDGPLFDMATNDSFLMLNYSSCDLIKHFSFVIWENIFPLFCYSTVEGKIEMKCIHKICIILHLLSTIQKEVWISANVSVMFWIDVVGNIRCSNYIPSKTRQILQFMHDEYLKHVNKNFHYFLVRATVSWRKRTNYLTNSTWREHISSLVYVVLIETRKQL